MPRRVPTYLVLPALAVVALLLHFSGLLKPIESGFRWALMPAARALSAIGIEVGRRSDPSGDPALLKDRVTELESRLNSVSVDYVKLRSLEEENRSLRKLAAFLSETGYDHVGAIVIARGTAARSATLLIDRGTNDGLETGMAVVAEDGVFVGKTMTVSERVSTVLLVSDERSRLAASVAGTRELLGMVQGEGDGVARMTLVPQQQPLKRDDIVVTAGTEEKIPANLSVALVNGVDGKPTDPFKTASLEPLARADRLDMVVVLRPSALRPVSK